MRVRRTESRLVGRRALLERVLELAAEPSVGAVLLSGPTGVGKSRLNEGIMLELESQGWRGVGLSATRPIGSVPFSSLSELIPEALDQLELADGQPGDGTAAELTVLRAVETALDLNGPTPTIIAIDEMASIDEWSAGLLVHLAANRRLFIVATETAGGDLETAVERLTPAVVVELPVEPLDAATTAELAADILGGPIGPGVARELWTRTRGNPLFVKELLATARADGSLPVVGGVFQLGGSLAVSSSLARQMLHRLGTLTPDERAGLDLMALAGDMSVDDLEQLMPIEAIDIMERRHVFVTRQRGGDLRVRFAHPLYADLVQADLSPLMRRRRQRELTGLLRAHGEPSPADQLLLALAALETGDEISGDELLGAGREALRLDHLRDAERLAAAAHRALGSEVSTTLWAETLTRQGRFVEAESVLATPLPADATDWDQARRTTRRASNQLWGFRDAVAAWNLDQATLDHIRPGDAYDRIVAHQAWIAYCDGRPMEALALLARLEDHDHPELRFVVSITGAPARIMAGLPEEAAAMAQRAWDEQLGADSEYGTAGQHLIGLGFAELYRGNLETARFVADQAIEYCRTGGLVPALLFFLDLSAQIELIAGHFEDAAAIFREAQSIAGELAIAASLRSAIAGEVIAAAQGGNREGAVTAWHRITDIPPAPEPRADTEISRAEAWKVVVDGDPAKGADLLRTMAEEARYRRLRTSELLALHDLARLGYGTPADARDALHSARFCQGPLLPLLGDHVSAIVTDDAARLDEVSQRFESLGFGLFSAEAAARASDAWSRAGDQRAATASLRVSQRQRGDLSPSSTPSLVARPSVDPLTRREREIARLAANGASNNEIAQQLHVSVRTVENHLHKIYRKLGVENRRALGDALAE